MKKTIVLLLTAAMIFGLCGCALPIGGGPVKEVSVPQTMRYDDRRASEYDVDPYAVQVDPIDLVNEQGVEIRLTSYKLGASFGPELGLHLVNRTDHRMNFSAIFAAINGYELRPLMSTFVDPGQETDTIVLLSCPDIYKLGFDVLEEAGFIFQIFDTDTEELYFNTDTVTARISGSGKTAEYVPDGVTVYEENGIRLILGNTVTEYDPFAGDADEESLWAAEYFLSNDSDQVVLAELEDLQINGVLMEQGVGDVDQYVAVRPGMRAVGTVAFTKGVLRELGIDSMDDISAAFVLSVTDAPWGTADWEMITRTEPVPVGMSYASPIFGTETVLMDQDGLKCVFTEIRRVFNDADYSIHFTIENHSGKKLTVETDDEFVNGVGYTATGMFETVPDGTTVTGCWKISNVFLTRYGISDITDLRLRVGYILSSKTYLKENITFAPMTTIRVSDEEYSSYESEGVLLYERDGVKIILESYGEDLFEISRLRLFIVNGTERDLHVETVTGSKINGEASKNKDYNRIDVDLTLPAHCRKLVAVQISKSFEEIEDLQFQLQFTDIGSGQQTGKSDSLKLVFEK